MSEFHLTVAQGNLDWTVAYCHDNDYLPGPGLVNVARRIARRKQRVRQRYQIAKERARRRLIADGVLKV